MDADLESKIAAQNVKHTAKHQPKRYYTHGSGRTGHGQECMWNMPDHLKEMFFILIHAYSKWMEVFPMDSSTSGATIEKLRMLFATHRLPEKIVSDNESNFTSEEFEQFLKMNGVKYVKTAPYHPALNGLAERAVQTFKESIKK